ncbi:MAG: hypothetical protein J2P55_08215 [Rhizobiales bacterium]|nr:hypothetical protein [Hyphomicrobiales bacterium]
MWLALLTIGLTLLAAGLFGLTEFSADLALRIHGAVMVVAGLVLIGLACYLLP